MNKPKLKTKSYLDWSECSKYLEEKYKFQMRDFAGLWKWTGQKTEQIYEEMGYPKGSDKNKLPVQIQAKCNIIYRKKFEKDEPPYQDFWHYICDTQTPNNGDTIYFSNQGLEGILDWQKTILEYILTEFGQGEERECEFEVSW